MLYKKGDVVKVYSLQSFSYGGFLNGEEGIVSQDQHGEQGSVLVAVKRNFDGVYKIDPSYEVYPEQLRKVNVKKPEEKVILEFSKLIERIKNKRG
jgi:hypothetical protein